MKISLWIEEGMTEELEVRPLENDLFEIAESPVLAGPDPRYGDIVRVRPLGDGVYEIQEVVERPYCHWEFLIPGEYGASRSIHEFGEWLVARGGQWDCVMSGLLFIHLPTGDESIEDVKAELEARWKVFERSEEYAELRRLGPHGVRDRPGSSRGEIRLNARAKGEERA
jgi:hypothetical protein